MERRYKYKLIAILLIGIAFYTSMSYTQVLDYVYFDDFRKYEFRQIKEDTAETKKFQFEEFWGTPVEHLHLYAYRAAESSWELIPFQIDEMGPDKYYAPDNGEWDDKDELVFMVQDLGDKVTPGNWINDAQALSNPRYEIMVFDTLDRTQKGWAYLYKSSTITEKPANYMKYYSGQDSVTSRFYKVGYSENGVLRSFAVTTEGGGSDVDLLDRQKTRIVGLAMPAGEYEFNENYFVKTRIDYKEGPIRVLRRIISDVIIAGDTWWAGVEMSSRFYPFSMSYSGQWAIPQMLGADLLRQSLDFDADAIGMSFHSTNNRNISVDGEPEPAGAVDDSLQHNALNWMMLTGNQGTIFIVNDLSFVGFSQRLYYWDNASGSTGDETQDTGDNKSYGDMGIVYRGDRMKDTLSYRSTIFFLPKNQSPDIGEPMQDDLANPLEASIHLETFLASVDDLDPNGVPREFRFLQNHPNPFNSSTVLSFELPKKSQVTLRIMNILGQTISVIVNKSLPAGRHDVAWNGLDSRGNEVVSSVYFALLEAETYRAIKKLIMIK